MLMYIYIICPDLSEEFATPQNAMTRNAFERRRCANSCVWNAGEGRGKISIFAFLSLRFHVVVG